eukprot:12445398-Heterocapsa_arctica.AAC.1
MGMKPKDGASAMARSPWSLRFYCKETEEVFLLSRLPKMLLHSSRMWLLMAVLSVPDFARFALKNQPEDKNIRLQIEYGVRITLCLAMAVLPYVSCVRRRLGMRACETFWVAS